MTLGSAAWRVGPLLLAGEDWQLRLQPMPARNGCTAR